MLSFKCVLISDSEEAPCDLVQEFVVLRRQLGEVYHSTHIKTSLNHGQPWHGHRVLTDNQGCIDSPAAQKKELPVFVYILGRCARGHSPMG